MQQRCFAVCQISKLSRFVIIWQRFDKRTFQQKTRLVQEPLNFSGQFWIFATDGEGGPKIAADAGLQAVAHCDRICFIHRVSGLMGRGSHDKFPKK